MWSNDRPCFSFELTIAHRCSFEGISLKWLSIKRHERLFVKVVRVRHHFLQLFARVWGRCPAWFHPLSKYLSLVVYEVVILIFLLRAGFCKNFLGTLESFFTNFSLKLIARNWKVARSFASNSESTCMEIFDSALVIGAWQKIDSIELVIGELFRRESVDFFKFVCMIIAFFPWLFGWAWLLWQKFFHTLLSITLVFHGLCSSILIQKMIQE